MKNPTLEENLSKRADARLAKDIEEKFGAVWKMFEDSKRYAPFGDRAGYFDDEKSKNIWVGEGFTAVKENFKKALTPLYRQREIDEFVEKVDKLGSQMDEIKDMVGM